MSAEPSMRVRVPVLGALIDALTWEQATGRLVEWAAARSSRYVCICNVHSVVTADQEPRFLEVVNGADMSTPDGAPVAWMLRRLGQPGQKRINGPDLMHRYLREAEHRQQVVSFYGSTEQTLDALRQQLSIEFPRLVVGVMISPPFRPLTDQERQTHIDAINAAFTGVLFVGLGCPKQELWMAEHRGKVMAAMVGVGAAFDFHAGTVRRAPQWVRNLGMEWLHRLMSEPRRLWKRYLVTNTLFIAKAARQLASRAKPPTTAKNR